MGNRRLKRGKQKLLLLSRKKIIVEAGNSDHLDVISYNAQISYTKHQRLLRMNSN